MLTPSELREKTFKSGGLGFDKKDVEQFMNELSSDIELLIRENDDLKKKVKDLTDSISYYKSIEKTLQKALVIAEKTAQDIKSNAIKEAEAIELKARANADGIRTQARKQSEMLEHKTLNLLKQYDLFKAHFKNLLNAQLELLGSASFSINTMDFTYQEDPENRVDEQIHEQLTDAGNEAAAGQTDKNLPDEEEFEFITVEDDD